jgi:cytoskeletal protein RodZ
MHVTGDRVHVAWQLKASDDELDEYISRMPPTLNVHKMARAERERRHFKRVSTPHWTMTPSFFVAFIAMIFAAIAAWPVIREWFQSAPPANKAANSQPPQSNSTPVTPPKTQTLPPATNAAQSTSH